MSDARDEGNLFLNFRGELTGLLGDGERLVFTSRRKESGDGSLYRLHLETKTLDSLDLETGVASLAGGPRGVFLAGENGAVYAGDFFSGELQTLVAPQSVPANALALLQGDRLAALRRTELCVYSAQDGRLLFSLPLDETGTALAASENGDFLALGQSSGQVRVFQCPRDEPLRESSVFPAHDGPVSALFFDPREERLYSAGADLFLKVSHLRGDPETEDRGGEGAHEKIINAFLLGGPDFFYTAGQDATVKRWPAGFSKKRPATLSDLGQSVRTLSLCRMFGKSSATLLCADNSLRVFTLDETGRFGENKLNIYDAYARARGEFKRGDVRARETSLRELNEYRDRKSLVLIAERARLDEDREIRQLAARLLTASQDPRAAALLEELLSHDDPEVQLTALAGLRSHEDASSLRPMKRALSIRTNDREGKLGRAAIQALETLARGDERALEEIQGALGLEPLPVRLEALNALERIHADEPAQALLFGLNSPFADLRLECLARVYRKEYQNRPNITQALRKMSEDSDAQVRARAFYVSLSERPKLQSALRRLDPGIQREILKLQEDGGSPDKPSEEGPPEQTGVPETASVTEATGESPEKPTEEDLRPLLQALSSRALDTALLGSRALALLGDARALGSLLQISREENEDIRIEACRALSELNDPRAFGRLRMMLHDSSARVGDAACNALFRLENVSPFKALEAAFNSGDENIRHRGLQLLLQLHRGPERPACPPYLERALNDPSLKISREAYKAILAAGVGEGGAPETLRFALRSLHPEIRRDVLTELQTRENEDNLGEIVFEFFNDPNKELRKSGFEYALERNASNPVEILDRAHKSSHGDIRLAGAKKLSEIINYSCPTG